MKFLSLLIIIILFSKVVQARPQYAAQEKLNCIQCHISPWGGGARKSFGKIYGAKGISESKHLEEDWYYLDFRAITAPQKKMMNQNSSSNSIDTNQAKQRKKHGLMTSQVALNYTILEDYTIALNYDLGSFNSKLRENYFLIEKENYTVLLGQFYLPFGLLTDEHRTYTKMLTASGLRDYETGIVLTKNFSDYLFTDIGLLKGFSSLNQSNEKFGVILNFRLIPENFNVITGISYLQHISNTTSPKAISLYFIHNLKKYPKLTVSFEYVLAKDFNDVNINSRYIPRIIPSSLLGNYSDSIKGKTSEASQVEMYYQINNKFRLIYKFDYLSLNNNKRDQNFIRNGFGFRYQPMSSISILAKYEFSSTSLPNYQFDSNTNTVTESKGPIFMLRAWY